MTLRELECDCNFLYSIEPTEIIRYISKKAWSHTQYVAWLQIIGDDVVVRTWAFRRRKDKPLQWTEVERKSLECGDWSVRKNMYLTTMSGYKVVYCQAENKIRYSSYFGYESEPVIFNRWGTEKSANIYAPIINIKDLFECDKYKYCGYSGECWNLFKYLRMYNEDPATEYFGKMGITPSKMLMNKCKKDRNFINFLRENAKDVNLYGVTATIYAYENKKTIEWASDYLYHKRSCERDTSDFKDIKIIKPDRIRICKYACDNKIGIRTYRDYWNACVNLGFDMRDTKNLYPNDFQRMHDMRIDEWNAIKAKQTEKERKQFYRAFAKKAAGLQELTFEDDTYKVIIPKNVSDLKNEGNKLHHCVGKMGYDKKMLEGRCIIGFIRLKTEEENPYVTCEYEKGIIKQCYADHDSKPKKEIIEFANKWAKYVKEVEHENILFDRRAD